MLLSEPRDLNVTYAAPGENRSFGEALADIGKVKVLPDLLSDEEVAARDEKMRRLFDAADNAQRLTGLMSSRTEALADAAQNRIDIVKSQTGVTLENPFRQGYFGEARQRVADMQRRGEQVDNPTQRAVEEQVNIFNEKISDLAETMPDKAKALQFFQPLAEQARAIANNAEDEFANASGDAPGPGEKLMGFIPTNGAWWSSSAPTQLIGGMWGSRRDPLSLVSFLAGPATTSGKYALSRIFMAGLRDSLFNAGQQIAAEPAVQQWRAERGKEFGIVPALEDVGWAAALGFIPGVSIQGAREAAPAFARIGAGAPERGDFATASKALGGKVDDGMRATIDAAERGFKAEESVAKEVPPAVPPEAHAEATAAAARYYEADELGAPPELPRFQEVEGERLKSPAVIAGDAVYEGASHAEATARAEARGAPKGSSTEGYVTTEGRFVTGDEAAALDLAERPIMQKLSALTPEAREFVENGSARPEIAAALADLPMPPEHQAAVLREVSLREPETPEAARSIAADQVERIGQQAEKKQISGELARIDAAPEEKTYRIGETPPGFLAPLRDLKGGEEVRFTNWKDIGGGFAVRQSTTDPQQQIRTPEGNVLIRGYEPNGKLFEEYEFSSSDPLAKGSMAWVDKAMQKLRDLSRRPDETVIERERLDTLDPTATANQIRSTKTDALAAVPLTRDDGTLVMVKPEAVAAAGARDRLLADLTGACK